MSLFPCRMEWRVESLWLPSTSALPSKTEWVRSNFPGSAAASGASVMTVASAADGSDGDVLTREGLLEVQ